MPEASRTLRARIRAQWQEVAACMVGLMVGAFGPVVCWHYEALARAGVIPPSQSRSYVGAPMDSPTRTYMLAMIFCIVIGVVALCALYRLLRSEPSSRRPGDA